MEETFLKIIDEHQGIIFKICRIYRGTREDQAVMEILPFIPAGINTSGIKPGCRNGRLPSQVIPCVETCADLIDTADAIIEQYSKKNWPPKRSLFPLLQSQDVSGQFF